MNGSKMVGKVYNSMYRRVCAFREYPVNLLMTMKVHSTSGNGTQTKTTPKAHKSGFRRCFTSQLFLIRQTVHLFLNKLGGKVFHYLIRQREQQHREVGVAFLEKQLVGVLFADFPRPLVKRMWLFRLCTIQHARQQALKFDATLKSIVGGIKGNFPYRQKRMQRRGTYAPLPMHALCFASCATATNTV